MQDGEVSYFREFYSPEKAWGLFRNLEQSIPFRQESIVLFGKSYKVPRLEAFYSKNGQVYTYSGKKMESLSFTEELCRVCSDVEEFTHHEFNSVLINLYRDGDDSNGWHADNEKELGINPVIASLSLGEERIIKFRKNKTKESRSLLMEHGSLMLMGGSLQHNWKHQIPKSNKIRNKRINLTFRSIMT